MQYFKKKHVIRIFIAALVGIILFSTLLDDRVDIRSVFLPTKELPIYSVDRDDKKIAISFDAAYGDEFTDDILEILDKYKVKSTFFLVGFWIDKYPHRVEEIHKKGHEIGNHSSTHPNIPKLSRDGVIKEIKETHDKIFKITDTNPILFRPPFGDYNDLLIQTARELGYYVIQWDIDSLDWKELGVEPVIDTVVKNTTSGSIILFHNNAKYIKEYLPIVIQRLQEKGFEIVPVSELIYKDNFRMDNSGRQIYIE
ncbi:deacetylase [Tissierella creatinini]|nr:deacetylase [Tissierella creatinini]TJX66683.1 deacetylase [Soehngenia saccharolytica]